MLQAAVSPVSVPTIGASTVHLNYAYHATSPNLVVHTSHDALRFDFATGESNRAVENSKIVAHGVLMTLAWALLFPVGVLLSTRK